MLFWWFVWAVFSWVLKFVVVTCGFCLLFLAFQNRYVVTIIRKVESHMFGNDGKYTHLSKKATNFRAMPIVPNTRAIWMQSLILIIGSFSDRRRKCVAETSSFVAYQCDSQLMHKPIEGSISQPKTQSG